MQQPDLKTCSRCFEAKPKDDFYPKKKEDPSKRRSRCKPCIKQVLGDNSLHWYHANKKRARDSRLKRVFGISASDYEEMFREQGGLCKICDSPPLKTRLAVDHCHATGRVRGLLCKLCNTAIGKLQDDPGLVERALEYLRESHAP